MTKLRKKLTYSNVIATVALFLALGGSAWAALGRNSVRARNIAPGSVTSTKIAGGAVNNRKLANGAITARNIAGGAVLRGALGTGSVGASAISPLSVNGSKLTNNAVTEAKIANNAVTGGKVNEATLGQVPDSKLLEGLGSTKFMKVERFGRTRVASGTVASGGAAPGIATFIANQGALDFTCNPNLRFTLRNTNATVPDRVWAGLDGAPPTFTAVPGAGSADFDSESGLGDPATGSIDWLIQTDDTLVKMTSVAHDNGADCSYAVYYEEVTLGGE